MVSSRIQSTFCCSDHQTRSGRRFVGVMCWGKAYGSSDRSAVKAYDGFRCCVTNDDSICSTLSCWSTYRRRDIATGQPLRMWSSDCWFPWQSMQEADARLPHLCRLLFVGSDSTVAFRANLKGSGGSLPTLLAQSAAASHQTASSSPPVVIDLANYSSAFPLPLW